MSAKVLLVEDDNNLREIFDMRLQAEGYKTVTAGDGEEALVVAVKEKPDLVIADVMMPKLSGFEMVENMRAAPELANTRVIMMMTALGQAEDRARGEKKLGVVKYLVKSQVTLEDFVRVVREVLPPDQDSTTATVVQPDNAAETASENINKQAESEKSMQDDNQVPTNPPADAGAAPAPDAAAPTNPVSEQPLDGVAGSEPQTTAQEENTVQNQINNFANDAGAGTGATGAPDVPAGDSSATGAADAATPAEPTDVPVSTPPVDAPATDGSNPPADDSGASNNTGETPPAGSTV